MAQILIDISTPNDGLGDPLRTAFDSTNLNFTELFNNKVDKVAGKDLSDNNYADADVTKLAGIAAGAEVNVQSDWNQNDTGQDDYIKNKPNIEGHFFDVFFLEEVSSGSEDFTLPIGVIATSVHIERGFRLSTEWSQTDQTVNIPGIATGKRVSIAGLQR